MKFDKLVSHYFPRTVLSVVVLIICAILYIPSTIFVILSVQIFIYVIASVVKCVLISELAKLSWFVFLFGIVTVIQLAADVATIVFLFIDFSVSYMEGEKAGLLFGASVASCFGLFLFDVWFTICVFLVIRRVRSGNEPLN